VPSCLTYAPHRGVLRCNTRADRRGATPIRVPSASRSGADTLAGAKPNLSWDGPSHASGRRLRAFAAALGRVCNRPSCGEKRPGRGRVAHAAQIGGRRKWDRLPDAADAATDVRQGTLTHLRFGRARLARPAVPRADLLLPVGYRSQPGCARRNRPRVRPDPRFVAVDR
jgi:hypothetical protein